MIFKQIEILNEIAEAAFTASEGEYDELVLEVEVHPKGGWTQERCWQSKNGEIEQLSLFGIHDPDLMTLSFELHDAVNKHTGGDLKSYTMTIDKEGTAKVDLDYHNNLQH